MPTLASLTLVLATLHTSPGLNPVNPGLLLNSADGLVLGAYRNSESRTSLLLGKQFSTPLLLAYQDKDTKELEAGVVGSLTVGLVTGYSSGPILAVVPTLSFGTSPAHSLNLSIIPPPSLLRKGASHAYGLNISYSFHFRN